ncbi:MAG: hypothetical protein AMJ46_02810 [Latescibacteria bacterium DG_63]|nr:MAG: hypothetical protein AMJ46_02810 [Latescibacteria bacterium DG_63]
MASIARFLRRRFLAGILVLVPLGITYLILRLLFNAIDNILAPYIETYFNIRIPGLGVVATIVIVFLVGLFATNVLGRRLLNYFDRGLSRIPLVGNLYVASRQVIEAVGGAGTESFKRVVFVEYPRRGLFTLGFVTRDNYLVNDTQGNKHEVVNIFVPTSPNPTSGVFIVAKASDVIRADLTVEQGIKLIVSGGIIVPPHPLVLEGAEDREEKQKSP